MIQLIDRMRAGNVKNDLLSGLTVALALVPEAIAFAVIAGVEPLVGLYAAFMVGLITAVFGGRPGMISGATGALAVVMVGLVTEHGVEYLFAAVVLMGFIQIMAGVLRLGKFIRMVPYPVMLGFVNGLAIVIFQAQFKEFPLPDNWTFGKPSTLTPVDLYPHNEVLSIKQQLWNWSYNIFLSIKELLEHQPLQLMLGLIALTMAIIFLFPKLTKAVPSTLVAIVVVSLLVIGLNIDTKTVFDVSSVKGGLPEFHIPTVPLTFETLKIILPYSLIFAAIGLIESLLTLTLIDELTETHGKTNKECVGQGAANIATGFFGGMGGCAMIGQSMININSGGRGRLSGASAAIFLLIFILFASSLIDQIPLAALLGVMFVVVIGTFEWASLRMLRKVPKQDAFIIVLVTVVTVFTDLAIAVVVGVIVAALVFAWEHAKQLRAEKSVDENGSKIYQLNGALFFGSIQNFNTIFDVKNDPDDVIIDFMHSRVYDHSGIDAIDKLASRYKTAGKTLHLRHLSPDCQKLLSTAKDLVEVNVMEDPKYNVADDALET